MAGIYLHIPFCKQACHYCDFHFSTNTKLKSNVIQAIKKEIFLQKGYLESESISSIYLGGGTPSILSASELESILHSIREHFDIEEACEITLEGNPDDLNLAKLKEIKEIGINRLSIGIQSFHDEHLKFMNRSHNAEEAKSVLENARKLGFKNISLDLIYGISSPSHEVWLDDLKQVMKYQPEHLSAYCLTIEEKTVFGKWKKQKKLKEVEEDFAAEQFNSLLEACQANNYEQYEISNFSKKGFHSRHNSNYWKQVKYLGIGPSAHSYNGTSRQFNLSNNSKYIQALEQNKIPSELIELDKSEQINEYILTSLRTVWGTDLAYLRQKYEFDLLTAKKHHLELLEKNDFISLTNKTIKLQKKGKLLADKIASDLFCD